MFVNGMRRWGGGGRGNGALSLLLEEEEEDWGGGGRGFCTMMRLHKIKKKVDEPFEPAKKQKMFRAISCYKYSQKRLNLTDLS